MNKPVSDFTADPYWGQGGRYIADPATGLRRPALDPVPVDAGPEAPETSPAAEMTDAQTATETVSPTSKEKNRG